MDKWLGTWHSACCTVMALSGNVVAEVFVLRGQAWLDAIPFGCWCHYWGVASFQLFEEDLVLFPRPRLSQLVPAHGPAVVLRLVTSNDPPPVSMCVVIGKAAATTRDYRPQPPTSPLRILWAADFDAPRFRFSATERSGPSVPRWSNSKTAAATLLWMLRCTVKLGKWMLREFRANDASSTYCLHVLVSSDGQRPVLRTKLLYDPVYLRVPVLEDGHNFPWDRASFKEICDALHQVASRQCLPALLSRVRPLLAQRGKTWWLHRRGGRSWCP